MLNQAVRTRLLRGQKIVRSVNSAARQVLPGTIRPSAVKTFDKQGRITNGFSARIHGASPSDARNNVEAAIYRGHSLDERDEAGLIIRDRLTARQLAARQPALLNRQFPDVVANRHSQVAVFNAEDFASLKHRTFAEDVVAAVCVLKKCNPLLWRQHGPIDAWYV